jgi:hypothetical protein
MAIRNVLFKKRNLLFNQREKLALQTKKNELLARDRALLEASVKYQQKFFIVTNWQSGVKHAIHFFVYSTFEDICWKIIGAFSEQNKEFRLYYLAITALWEKKERIEDVDTLMKYIDQLKNVKANERSVFFVFFGDVSPDGIPIKRLFLFNM